MLPKRYRLRHPAELERVRQHGRSWHHPLVVLLVIENTQAVSRFGFTASRRVGKATMRNRAKRLLREAVRCHLDAIEPGWDCLFIARPAITGAAWVEVKAAVSQLLVRANLLALAAGSAAPGEEA